MAKCRSHPNNMQPDNTGWLRLAESRRANDRWQRVIRVQAVRVLTALGVPIDGLKALPDLPSDAEGLLIYGSRARGDAVPGSDVDLLAMVATSRPSMSVGEVSISFYTADQLSTGVGTLFGAHLKRDAKVIWDQQGRLGRAIEAMGDVDTGRLFARAGQMAELFTSLEEDLPKYLPGLLREARYLLRSCLYAQAMAANAPCFSVRELANRHGDPNLARLLASRQKSESKVSDLHECLFRLRSIIGEFPPSRNGSLEATVVNEWGKPSDLLSMSFMALGLSGAGSDYAEVEKILL
jgi:predicted nucleotidyltransferase